MMALNRASCFFSAVSSNIKEMRLRMVAVKKAAWEYMYTYWGTYGAGITFKVTV